MDIRIVREPVEHAELEDFARAWHGIMAKAAVDTARGIVALGGEWHMDANVVLIADGSQQADVWGINLYPGEKGDAAIEFISLINIRPAQGNRGMELTDEMTRARITEIVREFFPTLSL